MACRYKVKIDGKLVGFVKRDEEFQDFSLEYLRSQIEDEIGELLPTEFKFVMKGIPVSGKQEMAYTVRDVAEGPTTMPRPSTEADGVNCNSNPNSSYIIELKELQHAVAAATVSLETKEGEQSTTTKVDLTTKSRRMIADRQDDKPPISVMTAPSRPHINRGIEQSVSHLVREIEEMQEEIEIAVGKKESMTVEPSERPSVGSQKSTCTHCHFRGHRRSSCRMQTCTSYLQCGMLLYHPEHRKMQNEVDHTIKSLRVQLKKKNDELSAVRAVGERTRMSFFAIMRPRLKDLDPIKYSRRHVIDRDLRYLGAACNHRIPSQDVDLEALINGVKAKSLSYLHQPKEEEDLQFTKESVTLSTFCSSYATMHSESDVSSVRKRSSSPIHDWKPKNRNVAKVSKASESLGYKFRQSLRPGGNLIQEDSLDIDSDPTYFGEALYSPAASHSHVPANKISHSTPSKKCTTKLELDLSRTSLDA